MPSFITPRERVYTFHPFVPFVFLTDIAFPSPDPLLLPTSHSPPPHAIPLVSVSLRAVTNPADISRFHLDHSTVTERPPHTTNLPSSPPVPSSPNRFTSVSECVNTCKDLKKRGKRSLANFMEDIGGEKGKKKEKGEKR